MYHFLLYRFLSQWAVSHVLAIVNSAAMVWRFLKKLNIQLPYDPEVPLWGIYPKKNNSERKTHGPCFFI